MRRKAARLARFLVGTGFLFSGCEGPRCEVGARPGRAFSAALEGWRLAGLPDPGQCLEDLRALPADPTDWGCSEKAAACLTYCVDDHYDAWGVYDRLVVVHPEYWPGAVETGEPLIHEAMHALSECSWGDADADHSSPAVWTAVGGETTAQARAVSAFEGEER